MNANCSHKYHYTYPSRNWSILNFIEHIKKREILEVFHMCQRYGRRKIIALKDRFRSKVNHRSYGSAMLSLAQRRYQGSKKLPGVRSEVNRLGGGVDLGKMCVNSGVYNGRL